MEVRQVQPVLERSVQQEVREVRVDLVLSDTQVASLRLTQREP
jgi:hypothetical protein